MKFRWIAVVVVVSILSSSLVGQCNTGLMKKLCNPSPKPVQPALTTTFGDIGHPDTMTPSIDPKGFDKFDMLEVGGTHLLAPGLYEAYVESFVLDGQGSIPAGGFYPAPIKGSRSDVVLHILRNSGHFPQIQHDAIQELLLGVVQGMDLQNMSPQAQQAAASLLVPDELKQLHGSAASGQRVMKWLKNRMANNSQVQGVVGQVESTVNQADQKYGISDIVGGSAPAPASPSLQQVVPPIPRGTWVKMSVFYVRYLPEGTGRMRVQILVPAGIVFVPQVNFDPTEFIAMSGGSPSVRLGISMRPVEGQ